MFLTLPFTLKLAGKYYSDSITAHYMQMCVVVGAAAVFGILIIGQLRKMMNTVIRDDCFVWENVKSLELMSVYSFVISVLFCAKLFFLPTIATAIVIIVFFVAALFSIVLSFVFCQAVTYKEENDLTI